MVAFLTKLHFVCEKRLSVNDLFRYLFTAWHGAGSSGPADNKNGRDGVATISVSSAMFCSCIVCPDLHNGETLSLHKTC